MQTTCCDNADLRRKRAKVAELQRLREASGVAGPAEEPRATSSPAPASDTGSRVVGQAAEASAGAGAADMARGGGGAAADEGIFL